MKLSVSNIGWGAENDIDIYRFLADMGFDALEIAPTRILNDPYYNLSAAADWAKSLKKMFGLSVSSMQSIWFGRSERLFGSEGEYSILVEYTKRAIEFAQTIGCGNLVFGCPRNRAIPDGTDASRGMEFFYEIGEYAKKHGTVIGLEANPAVYNTNYINTTADALNIIKTVGSDGLKLNLDIGTMLINGEDCDILKDDISLINHIHISEEALAPIQKRPLHDRLAQMLAQNGYSGYVSVEMKKTDDISDIKNAAKYLKSVFKAE